MMREEDLPRDSDYTWLDEARCAVYDKEGNILIDTDIFFPPRDKALYKKVANEAKTFCFGPNRTSPCPVRANCLWEAVRNEHNHGIWGGLSHRERNALVRKWRKQYKDKMTLKEYIFQLDTKENHVNSKNRLA